MHLVSILSVITFKSFYLESFYYLIVLHDTLKFIVMGLGMGLFWPIVQRIWDPFPFEIYVIQLWGRFWYFFFNCFILSKYIHISTLGESKKYYNLIEWLSRRPGRKKLRKFPRSRAKRSISLELDKGCSLSPVLCEIVPVKKDKTNQTHEDWKKAVITGKWYDYLLLKSQRISTQMIKS